LDAQQGDVRIKWCNSDGYGDVRQVWCKPNEAILENIKKFKEEKEGRAGSFEATCGGRGRETHISQPFGPLA
jgi:hypothetical protein